MPKKTPREKNSNFFDKYYFSKKSAGKERQKDLNCLDKFYFKEYHPPNVQELITEKIIEDHSCRKILEIGCGKGDNIIHLLDRGFDGRVFGIDISSVGIRHAKRKIKNKKAIFSVQSASKLDFPADFFDCVYIVNVLHHIDEKRLPKVIKEIEKSFKKRRKVVDSRS